jgi:oxygen-independent coproporphyrinogen-3 oxidase
VKAAALPTVVETACTPPRSVYIHVPFCAHKCGYCDFASLAGVDDLAGRYLATLKQEMERCGEGRPREVDTIFIGGGTPTRLKPAELGDLLAVVARWFPLASGGEWTVEANPGSLDAQKADLLAGAGVNRVSLGAQSFQPPLLQALERNHAPEEVAAALELIRPRFPRWSIDLIFGVPGSRVDDWAADLDTALQLGPAHLSCYGLVYEKGTAFWKRWKDGQVKAVDEEVERSMYALAIDRLTGSGLLQYEISNFARIGHESRHNLVYWANDAYEGVGLGAARYVDGVRSVNTRDLPAYLKRIETGQPATGPTERLNAEARARETAMLMLRRTAMGLDRDDFAGRTGFDFDALAGQAVKRHVARGLLEDDGRRVRLTREGLFLADSVLSDML